MSHYSFDVYCEECENYICSYYFDYTGKIERLCRMCKIKKETPIERLIRKLKEIS